MGSLKVTVFGRIKPCLKLPLEYKIKTSDEEDQISFVTPRMPTKRSFKFRKIFGEEATQEEIFETVAKPVVSNLFSGYNGTIFTYGQTGSGKTYTMTGDVEDWTNPGLIPRIIQEVFKVKTPETLITISFCEIYNEHIYDLVRNDVPEVEATTISMVTESSSGITNFRNLSNHSVKTAEEAMQLFLRGDSNKMVAETGSNFRSSRSHAIFSISLEFQHPTQENFRMKPVLYLVDLAGSERLSKCKTPLSNVSETRYINLSLHYLEQVLLALRQPGRAHIPYRNSLMTALLKNSLGGNSITIMIATLSVYKDDAEETTQTCRFAERVALIKNEVKLIELSNPEKEIDYLKKENERLKAQLKILCNEQVVEQLDEKDKEKCIEVVRNFILENDYFDLPLTNIRRMEYCFKIMRDEILKEKELPDVKCVKSKHSRLEIFKSVRAAKSVKSVKSAKNIKTVKSLSYIKSVKTFKDYRTEESRSRLLDLNSRTSSSKLFEKINSVEIPKINIIYGGKEQDKKNDAQRSKDMKVKSLKATGLKEDKFKHNNSKQTTQIFFKKSGFGVESDWPEDKYLVNKADTRSSACLSESLLKKNENNNLCDDELPPVRLISSLFQDFQEKNSKKSIEENFQTTEEKSHQEKNLRVPSAHNFMAFTSKCIPLTGDKEVDEEIIKFYKTRYQLFKNK